MISGGNGLVVTSTLLSAYPEPGMELSIFYALSFIAPASAPLPLMCLCRKRAYGLDAQIG